MSKTSDGEGEERGEAVLAIFERGAEFTKELLSENSRLRGELHQVQKRNHEAAQSEIGDALPHEGKLNGRVQSPATSAERNRSFRMAFKPTSAEQTPRMREVPVFL